MRDRWTIVRISFCVHAGENIYIYIYILPNVSVRVICMWSAEKRRLFPFSLFFLPPFYIQCTAWHGSSYCAHFCIQRVSLTTTRGIRGIKSIQSTIRSPIPVLLEAQCSPGARRLAPVFDHFSDDAVSSTRGRSTLHRSWWLAVEVGKGIVGGKLYGVPVRLAFWRLNARTRRSCSCHIDNLVLIAIDRWSMSTREILLEQLLRFGCLSVSFSLSSNFSLYGTVWYAANRVAVTR